MTDDRSNIIRKLLDEANGAAISLPPETGTKPRPWRGHAPKIAAAVDALRAEGKLPPHLRPGMRDKRVIEELIRQGYNTDLPGRDALRRFFKSERR